MSRIPRDKSLDSTIALMGDPYRFISNRCRRYRSDLFETRLLLRKTICMTGPEAARLFYDQSRFARHGAMPKAIQKTLLGVGGVQGLDEGAHRHRKQMFMSLMTPEGIEKLVRLTSAEWQIRVRKWASMNAVVLYPELHALLTRAACAWAGVPLADSEVEPRTRQVTALFDHAGSIGLRHLWSRRARKRADSWAADIVEQIRSGRLRAPEHSAAHVVAWHRDFSGALLTPQVAAVELINVIRPTVAVSVYMIFVAHALHTHPQVREKLQAGDEDYAECFVQEVRRYYPFFPAVAAQTRLAFEWNGYQFPAGRRILLDLYGTNQDPRTWERPEDFEPERFGRRDGSPFNFIPQGGGDHYFDHRCPGEWIAIELMKLTADFLTRRMSYEVPGQDLRIEWSRLPALPRSRFVLSNVRECQELHLQRTRWRRR
ncbi:cytochrome P450 [Sphingopyxis alaskensis]|uniref:Fatty acid alpha hydroxylase, cytochrome P450 n=1 Tax=Sphingopyxis alaskensis (strain DSM 13593 / LMG 18877 / RB2256) TaxID=317655 RepID=Q1GQ10_SPHAL|nr:cytochrome P450 [Sphingopyxis alaskensis]ABF54262.1 fatty acid alpha hydroxylase, cytochrome P450 [Sphingopyxis alaskensis RB2256]MCM3418026.1 cytochrome P450 [Sphingopyxis alaskensis]